ncbi:TetR/AcrR family transcriptional regulator [Scrofimicrobium sp. R131]|uniref:TetR/AcrR family transcriptional regulator n=1 Tax=Scrofimicrobium appendicitidis TaxID=3079930 RepID=A0AAU7V935_9ACTO
MTKTRPGVTLARLRAVSLDLFATHGIVGTSLQMIAEAMGVSKAAVYHHYPTKDAIVKAVMQPAFDGFARLVEEAESLEPGPERQLFLVTGLADQAVANRALYAVMFQDLAVLEIITRDVQLADLFWRLRAHLVDPHDGPLPELRAGIFLSGLVAPVRGDLSNGIPDDQLREAILDSGVRLLINSSHSEGQRSHD